MEIIRKIYLRSIKMNILISLLFVAMLVAVNIEFTNLIRVCSYEAQITDFPKDYYYLSISDSLTNIKSNQELLSTVLNTGEVETIGNYELRDGQLDNNTCKIYELNSAMQKIKYKLSDGSWFTDESECQLILGGAISQKYNIGDWINVSENNHNYKGRVIGKLKNPAYLMHLNYAQYDEIEALSYEQILYSYYDNICLSNQYDGSVSDLKIKCAWILDGKSNFTESDFESVGNAVSLTQIKKNTTQEIQMQVFRSMTYFIMLLALFVFSVLSMSYISIGKEMDFILICKVCGAKLKDILKILFGIYFFDIIIAILLFMFLQVLNKNINIYNLEANNIIYGYIILVLIYMILAGLIQFIYLYFLLKKSFHEMKERT